MGIWTFKVLSVQEREDPTNEGSVSMQIMIAEADSRRKGIAKEALLIMMVHGHDRLVTVPLTKFQGSIKRLPSLTVVAIVTKAPYSRICIASESLDNCITAKGRALVFHVHQRQASSPFLPCEQLAVQCHAFTRAG